MSKPQKMPKTGENALKACRKQVDEDLLERGMLSAPVDPWMGEEDGGPCADLGFPWPFGLQYSRMANDMPEARLETSGKP